MAKENKTVDLNNVEIHNFSKGWNVDLDNHAEKPENYADAWNGRLYSKDGTLAFTSISGTKMVYNNDSIHKYNGYFAFKDELIVFAKGSIPVNLIETEEKEIVQITVENFKVFSNTNEILGVNFSDHYTENTVTINVPVDIIDQDDFKQNLTYEENQNEIDVTYGGLFKTLIYMPTEPIICQLIDDLPINNENDFNDIIISFKYSNLGTLISKILYSGHLNIPYDAVITTEGVDENINYKRVYFSDYYNPTRVVNIKDQDLFARNSFEFDIKTKGILLNPRINSINENGQLKAMTVFYVMKLFTENGQETDFSPLSKGVKITKGTGSVQSGGEVSEETNKSVVVDCYIPDHKNFKEVQLIAIEFESKDVPTTIRLIGTKLVNSIISFEHFGSESEYNANITLSDLFANSIGWKYNSDFAIENNKLIVSGLRNDPSFINSKNIALDFSLAGFDVNGNTHSCLLNPEPTRFNLINNNLNEAFFYIKRKLYRKIEVFGNFKMKLYNSLTNSFYELIVPEIVYDYVDRTKLIASFLLEKKEDFEFSVKFPNLNIRIAGTKILFEPINDLIPTDFQKYNLVFTTSQVIIDLENDTENKNISWPVSDNDKDLNLVYGGVSNGWFNGNGVKITMHSVKESVLQKNTAWMNGSDLPLKITAPSFKKCVMKGEVYRLGIQFLKNGNRLFAVILGDLKIPDIGQRKRELDVNGNVIPSVVTYKNWSIENNEMFAEKIELQFDVRINCELSKEADSYQIVYVERTENNRTILAQGISAPLERMSDFGGSGDAREEFEETMVEKWMLPSNGGPVYDYQGLLNYDINPDMNDKASDGFKTIVTSRKSFYFDSPDFVHNKISTNFVESCVLEYIETIATDHDRHNIMGGYNEFTCGNDNYNGGDPSDEGNPGCMAYSINGSYSKNGPYAFEGPKFSQKIPSNLLAGEEKKRPFWVNVSVFSNSLKSRSYNFFQNEIGEEFKYLIQKAIELGPGEIASGYKMNDSFDYANHALSLGNPGWFYGRDARRTSREHTTFRVNNIAGGRKSVFIKTKENYFTSTLISQAPYIIKSKVNFGATSYQNNDELKANDAYIVSNLKRNNKDSIYGGRTEFAYSSNEYIAMSDVMPIQNKVVASQIFYVEGDTYCSLYLRNKSSYINSQKPELIGFHWDNFPSTGGNASQRRWQYNKYNAWCYGVVLESTIEPRLSNSNEFYLFSKSIDFNYQEIYNSGYLQENTLRKSIPVPYNFKDDPILNNIIAVSKTKMNGDHIDNWTKFLTNEFYELDKNMGTAFNIIKENDELYVIQENQTSRIFIDEKSFVTPDNGGSAIQINQGNGASISGHKVVSQYGTSFRRAVVKNPFGFVFFDENKNEIVKITQPLLITNNLALEVKSMFENNKVVGIENYYDEEYKEINIRFRTENDFNFVISYNELLKVFNGKIDYDNDLYFMFQNKVLAPYNESKKIGELNNGKQLEFFDIQKNLILKVISAPLFYETKINKGIAVYLNTNYPLLKSTFITSLGHQRIILGSHHWYKIREGVHTLPTKNPNDYDDIRGEWCSIELELEVVDNKEIKIFSIINYFRKSYK